MLIETLDLHTAWYQKNSHREPFPGETLQDPVHLFYFSLFLAHFYHINLKYQNQKKNLIYLYTDLHYCSANN